MGGIVPDHALNPHGADHPFTLVLRSSRTLDRHWLALLAPIPPCGAVVHLAHLVRHAGVEKYAFGGRGLTGINVRTDAAVALPFDGRSSGHCVFAVRAMESG